MKQTLAVFAAIWLAAAPVLAEEPPTKFMTWDEAVAYALRNNPDLASSRFLEQADQANFRGSFNGVMPNLTLSNSYNTSNTAGPTTNKYTGELSANMSLLNASSIASVRSASATLLQARATLWQTSASVRFALRQAFAQMIFARKSWEVDKNIRDMRDRDSQLVSLRYNSGTESKGNMMRAKAQLLQAEADLAQAERALRTAQRTFDRELGLDDFEVVAATGSLETGPAPGAPGNDFSYVEHRPDVALQAAVVQSARVAVSSARAPLWPSLTGNYARSRFDRTEFPSDNYAWTGGVTLSLPIFGGGPTSVYYAVGSAKKSLEKALSDLRATRDAAVVDLETSWAGFAGAVDQVGVQSALLVAARQRNDEADVRYASGLLTFDNWEIIASDRINQERQAVSSEFNAAVAKASWEKSIGLRLGE